MATILTPGDLPPWAQISLFRVPVETLVPGATLGQQLCKGDANRSILIFGQSTGALISVSTYPNPAAGQGIPVTTSAGLVMITAREWGPMVCLPWYMGSIGPATISVIEVMLNDWPNPAHMQDSGDYYDASALPYAVDPADYDLGRDYGYYYSALQSATNRLVNNGN